MIPYLSMLIKTPLFSTLTLEELPHMLNCLNARTKHYQAKQYILREEDTINDVGVILNGSVQVITEDALGNRSITAKLTQGELFGEVIASSRNPTSPVSVMADTDCDILLLKFGKIVTPCVRVCSFHSRVIENMMHILAERNLMMNRKLSILSQRSTREKLLAYLAWQSEINASMQFDIPFNRDELADFLCVNRSALSREISRMIDENIINSDRNHFTIHDNTFI
jgi:CRP/FNR family transcriptional regulator, dissimilatory nitrate respiration regulator